ncbi:MAG: helix-hairpin-helix domain-containing protein [Streptosporangiales bacterium]|nr:helix-hairpin-helix domain-containing protein [Streptosporangiales bacterium]MBO0891410.1 helix-hairpin-helix domain-containing protein [Acidothermales bacterium]
MASKRNEQRAASAARVGRVLPPAGGGWVPTGETIDDEAEAADGAEVDEDPAGQEPAGLPPPSLRETLRAAALDRLPPTLRGVRVGPGRRGLYALLVVALLAVAVGGASWWRSRSVPSALPPVAVRSVAPSGATAASSATSTPRLIVVDVVGKVRRPGIVRLPDGSRVYDAIRAAGGVKGRADTSGLNLARRLVDGEQVVVGVAASPGASPPVGGSSSTAPGAKVDLNTATLEQLDGLPGVGPVLAQRILDYRTKIGSFASVSQLNEVSGIGPARYADLEPLVTV